jgi:hypothetical protein
MDNEKKLYGIYRGRVFDVKDPKKQNRIRVIVDGFGKDPTTWADAMEPASTHTLAPVTVGQGVWVMFEKGSPNAPLWFGEFGKHLAKSKKVLIKPLLDSVSLTGLSSYLMVTKQTDGTYEVDLVASLVAMAQKLKDHETRITALEGQAHTH